MGWQATGWAFRAPITNAGCKFVLVALAERAGNEDDELRTWTCHPSIDTISKYTAQGYRTIQRHLDWLEDHGLVSRKQRVQSRGRKGCFDFTLNPHQWPNGQIGQWPETAPQGVEIGQTEPVIGTGQDVVLRTPDPFEEWWAAYPLKKAKVAARKMWAKVPGRLAAEGLTLEDLMVRTRAYADHVVDLEPRHIAHGATWLNGERWMDELPPRSQTDGRNPRAAGVNPADRRTDQIVNPMLRGAVEAAKRGRRWTVGG